MPEFEALAHNLKLIRKVKQINQEDFAAECGISVETLSLLECEKVDFRMTTLQKIAAYVGCETPELIKKNGSLNLYTVKDINKPKDKE